MRSDRSPLASVIVNYHYCHPQGGSFQSLNGIRPDALDRHLNALGQYFRFVTLSELLQDPQPSAPVVALTFDDGLKDFAIHVAPVLARHQAPATFFVSSQPLRERRLMAVHRTHLLLGEIGVSELRARVQAALPRYGTIERDSPQRLGITTLYVHDTPEASDLKRALNYELPLQVADDILGAIFATVFGDEAAIAEQFYLSEADVRRCLDEGHELGLHSDTHPVMSRLSAADQEAEIVRCGEYLSAMTRRAEFTFAYPYGIPGTFNSDTVDALARCPFVRAAVTLERRAATPADIDARYRIPRYDNTDVFHADGTFKSSFVEHVMERAL